MPERPIRIAHVITRMILGGAQENTLLTCRGLHEHPDYEVTLVTGPAIGPEGELLSEARRLGFDVAVVPHLRRAIHPWRDAAAARALRRVVGELGPRVVHTHSSKAGILGRRAARAEAVPVVVHTIHGLPFHPYEKGWRNALYVRLERRAAQWTDRLVSVADAMTEQAVAAGVAPRSKFVTIYSGMDTEAFLRCGEHREAVRREYGFGPEDFVVGKIARLFELKGHDYVLRAAQRLVRRHPRMRFLFVGDGVLRQPLEEQAVRLGLRDKVVFAGLVPASAMPRHIAAMDALVHASLREGLARVLPQALLAGKPVVSFDVDGAREVVVDGRTGRLVPPESVEGLSEALGDVAEHPRRAAAMAQRGRELCRERFPWRRMVEQLDRLYKELLAAKDVERP
ncbi:MAG: glycosyltransferase family 4 protein [Candidatus Brocadiia bacterium]